MRLEHHLLADRPDFLLPWMFICIWKMILDTTYLLLITEGEVCARALIGLLHLYLERAHLVAKGLRSLNSLQ